MNLDKGPQLFVAAFLSVVMVLSLGYSLFVTFSESDPVEAHNQPVRVEYGVVQDAPEGCHEEEEVGGAHNHPTGCPYGVFVKIGDEIVDANNQAHQGHFSSGDRVKVAWYESSDTPYLEDEDRTIPLIALIGIFIVISALVAKWTGIRAVLGLGATFAILLGVIVPAILGGTPAIPITIAGVSLILFIVVYSTHGISWMTSSALTGTIVSMLVGAVIGQFSIWALSLGDVMEMGEGFRSTLPGVILDTSGIMLAGFIAGTVGALNDVTISQASTAWEMRDHGRVKAFTSAMKVGRDHIASSIYTIAFAYAGSSIPSLILIVAMTDGPREMFTFDSIVVEIARAAIAGIAIAISVPITTSLVVALMSGNGKSDSVSEQEDMQEID